MTGPDFVTKAEDWPAFQEKWRATFADHAKIDAKATYSILGEATVVGERAYNTTSTAWAGVFAKMTPQQVDAVATQVFAELEVTPPK